MQNTEYLLSNFAQNDKMPIRIVSPTFGHLPAEIADAFGLVHRSSHYFFLFMINGCTRHGVDLQEFEVNDNELLFLLPHQIHQVPATKQGTNYFKIGFDETCLARLPRQYAFLINPLNNQKISFTAAAATRLQAIFEILLQLLSSPNTESELILAHLNSLLTEVNSAYFAAAKNPGSDKLAKYINFKIFVENNLTDHPSITAIAEELALNPNSLYQIVKHYSGLSPKEFITNRLILEARRRLYYTQSSSVKELAYELGFNDPEYFSRLFKKVTGKTIGMFFQDLSGN